MSSHLPSPSDGARTAPPGDDNRYRRQLRAVAENATLALFIMDERQHCTYMNPAAERMTGFTLDEVRGHPLHDLIHHTRPDGSPYPLDECPIDQAFPANMREQGEEVFVHKDGSFYPVAFTASPIVENGAPVGTIIEARDITGERRFSEEREGLLRALDIERNRLNEVFHQAPAFIAVLRGPEHVFELTNPAYLKLIGHRQVVGLPVREALPEIEGQGFLELLDNVFETGEPFLGTEVRVRVQQRPGSEPIERFLNFVYQPLRDADQVIAGVIAHGVDVTEQVRAREHAEEQAQELESQAADLEEAQAELEAMNARLLERTEAAERALQTAETSRSRLQAVLDTIPAGVVLAEGAEGRIVLGNQRVEEILRHPVLLSETVDAYGEWKGFHPDGRPVTAGEWPLAKALQGEVVHGFDALYERGDGTREWIRLSAAPIRSQSGDISGAVAIFYDVGREKRVEAEREQLLDDVRTERTRLQEVFDHSPAVMALFSGPNHRIEMVNPSWEKTVGKPDAVGRPYREVFAEFAGTGLFERLDEIYRTGEPYVNREEAVPLDRWGTGELEETTWDHSWLPLPPRENGERDILVHAIEITEQARTRAQLRGLTEAALAINSTGTLDEILQVVTDQARRLVGAHQAVTSLTTGKDWAQAINAVSLSERYAEYRGFDARPDGSGIYAMVCEANKSARMTQAELEAHPRWRGFGDRAAEHPPMNGWLAAPLTGPDGRNVGLIQLTDRHAGEFTESDEATLVQLAQLASGAIENARLFEETAEANRAKSDFLATMSHELRTPLNAMIGYTDLLEMGVPEAVGPKALAYVERIGLSAKHLLQLIEEILTFSRIEADRERVDWEPVSLGAVTAEVRAIIEPLAQQKALDFRVEMPEAPISIETDPRKLRQILLNLLGNAIKFTETGEVGFRSEVDGEVVVLEVSDTGAGISRKDLRRIFEPFWQGETELHARLSGTGLGLPVTKRLAELLGGSIEVESDEGEGTTFRVRLPLRRGPETIAP